MHIPARLLRMIPTAAVGAAAFTLTTQTVQAFFPPITAPPAGGPVTVSPPPPPPVIIPVVPEVPVPPVTPPPPVVPPVPPPQFVPPPPPPVVPPQGEPDCDCCQPTTPQTVPEPATVVTGLIGLSVLGGYKWTRRKKGGPVTE
jgi:hypothetical protein